MSQRDTFRVVRFDEDGVRGTPGNIRLVCCLDGGGKIVLWGEDGHSGNIDKVVQAGFPCTIECEYREPGEKFAQQYGHTHWVNQESELHVV